MIYLDKFQEIIEGLKEEGNYRVFNDILRERGKFPQAIWYSKYAVKRIVNWCSNDYLGMGQHRYVIDAMRTALESSGAGSGGTRNISGTTHYHVALEQAKNNPDFTLAIHQPIRMAYLQLKPSKKTT